MDSLTNKIDAVGESEEAGSELHHRPCILAPVEIQF
jgi:hypothetical protein